MFYKLIKIYHSSTINSRILAILTLEACTLSITSLIKESIHRYNLPQTVRMNDLRIQTSSFSIKILC
jgi:hypothetical protein